MATNYNLKYRTFDSLVDDVSLDFKSYDLEQLIDRGQLIKVARRVSYDLGLRINMTKEAVLTLEKGRVKLPDDFYVFNYAMICGEYSVSTIMPQGTHIEERPYVPYQEVKWHTDICNQTTCDTPVNFQCDCPTQKVEVPDYNPLIPYGDYCVTPRVFMNCKGESYELIQIVNSQTRTYSQFRPLRLKMTNKDVDCNCPNVHIRCADEVWIKDGWIYANFQEGNLYLNYQSDLVDEDNNLLVTDHPLINEYYEYALKQRILESMFFNGEQVENKISLIEQRLKVARNNAVSMVNTPNFSEMLEVWKMNRRVHEQKYFKAFESFTYLYP